MPTNRGHNTFYYKKNRVNFRKSYPDEKKQLKPD